MPKQESNVDVKTPEELLSMAASDTVAAMIEVYEATEQSYRAAMMAGTATTPRVAHSTNPS